MAQVADLHGVLRGLRRRGYVVLAVVLVGVVGAGMFVVVSPTTYLAKTRVVLPPSPVDSLGHDVRDINTEVQIVRGSAVLGPATKSVQPPVALSALQRAISVRGVSSQIIEIAAHSASATRAADLANAVAASYVAFADDSATAEANATAAAYSQAVTQLTQQVQQLDQQIANNTAALSGLSASEAQRREAVIDTLRSQQSTLAQQLNINRSRIADAELQSQLSRQGTQVLQPALVPKHPASPKPALDLALGALAGLLIGGIVALAIENGDHRLRSRDKISDAIGAPVLASLAVKAVNRPDRCRDLLEHWEPSVVESYALGQAFGRLATTGPMSHLVLVGVDGDTPAVALALELALFSAMRGTETAFVFASHDDGSAILRASCAVAAPDGRSDRAGLVIQGATGQVEQHLIERAELVVTLVVADAGPIILPTWDRPTQAALVVSAGFAGADRVDAVAATCLDAGVALSGAFVANPDPNDRSTGHRGVPLAMKGTTWADPDYRAKTTEGGNGRPPEPTKTRRTQAGRSVASRPQPAGSEVGGTTETGHTG